MGTNYGNHGKKGRSGRKGAYVELANARKLNELYFEKQDQGQIETDIKAGKFSIMQRHILNAMEGDQKAITPIFQKLFPDSIEVKEDVVLKIDV